MKTSTFACSKSTPSACLWSGPRSSGYPVVVWSKCIIASREGWLSATAHSNFSRGLELHKWAEKLHFDRAWGLRFASKPGERTCRSLSGQIGLEDLRLRGLLRAFEVPRSPEKGRHKHRRTSSIACESLQDPQASLNLANSWSSFCPLSKTCDLNFSLLPTWINIDTDHD